MGQLAHELSLLIRRDLEAAAAELLPLIRRLLEEVGALLALAFAGLLMLGLASWGAVRGLSLVVPSWAAPLLVAAAWTLVAGGLLYLEHPWRLLRRLRADRHRLVQGAAARSREEAEETIRATASALARAVLREAMQREVKTLEALGEREAEAGATRRPTCSGS